MNEAAAPLDPRSLSLPQQMVVGALQCTKTVWRQTIGDVSEGLESAWKRIFGRPMTTPLLFSAIPLGGRYLTAHLHPGGIVCLYDPATGWAIRVLKREAQATLGMVANMGAALQAVKRRSDAFTLGFEDGRVGEAGLRWVAQRPG